LTVISITACNDDRSWDKEEKAAVIEERRPILDEIISLCEKILEGCTDDNHRHSAVWNLCHTYAFLGEREKAKTYAMKMPHHSYTRADLITHALEGTAKYNHIRDGIGRSVFYDVLNAMAFLVTTPLDGGAEPYTSDERMEICHKVIDIVNIIIEKGSFGDFSFRLLGVHSELATLYSKKGDAAAALEHFKLAAKHAIAYEAMPSALDENREEYTSLLLRGMKFPFNTAHMPFGATTEHLLEKSVELEGIVPAAELEKIRAELRVSVE